MVKRKLKKQIEFYELVAMPTMERVEKGYPETLMGMADYLGVMYATVIKWHKNAKALGISRIDEKNENIKPLPPLSADEKEKEAYMKKLYNETMEKGCQSNKMELYAKLKGWMPKTSLDVTLGLSADERIRRNLEADRQLEEGGYK